jgi:beta-N-acetylhexosaminidase
VVTVAVQEPYDIAWYASSARVHLATYSASAESMSALARVISGRWAPEGRLPVAVPRAGGGILYRFGHGLGYLDLAEGQPGEALGARETHR